jgi:hypothetical protein
MKLYTRSTLRTRQGSLRQSLAERDAASPRQGRRPRLDPQRFAFALGAPALPALLLAMNRNTKQ